MRLTPRLLLRTSLQTAHLCRSKPSIALSGDGLVPGPRGGFPPARGPEQSTLQSAECARSPRSFAGNWWFFSEVPTLPCVLQHPRIQDARTSRDNPKTTKRSTTAREKPLPPLPMSHPPHLLPRGLLPWLGITPSDISSSQRRTLPESIFSCESDWILHSVLKPCDQLLAPRRRCHSAETGARSPSLPVCHSNPMPILSGIGSLTSLIPIRTSLRAHCGSAGRGAPRPSRSLIPSATENSSRWPPPRRLLIRSLLQATGRRSLSPERAPTIVLGTTCLSRSLRRRSHG